MLSPQPRFGFKLQILSKPATSEGKMATIAAVTGRLLNPHHTMDSTSPEMGPARCRRPQLKRRHHFSGLITWSQECEVYTDTYTRSAMRIMLKRRSRKGLMASRQLILSMGWRGRFLARRPCKRPLLNKEITVGMEVGANPRLYVLNAFWQQI